MKLGGLFGGRRKSRTTKKKKAGSRSRSSRRKTGAGLPFLPWVLGAAAVLLVAGVGLVKWSSTRPGQAALLSMGSEKMFAEVQDAVEQALLPVFPELMPGPANAAVAGSDPADFDWPAPQLADGAHVRCRRLAVPADVPYRVLQLEAQQALAQVHGKVLWAQRLYADPDSDRHREPDEATDCLRLDVGVPGKPTHTLVLHRQGTRPPVRWGHGPQQTAWSRLAAHGERPVVALVIDDWGYGKTEATRLLADLPVPLTMAVLPYLSFSREFALAKTDLVLPPQTLDLAASARQSSAAGRKERLDAGCFVEVAALEGKSRQQDRRREILLHLPMEPQGYPEPDPGPQAVMVGMGKREIEARLDKALDALDRVTGVNNHMGSAATSDRATMENLMEVLQDRDLLFLDSLTTANSVAFEVALEKGLPALRNRIFLDYDNDNEEKIAANLASLVTAARSRGFAVGIGHPHRATARVLAREVPRLVKQGVIFVTVSELYALQQQNQAVVQ